MFMHRTDTALAEAMAQEVAFIEETGDAAARSVVAVLSLLDEAGIAYCIPHGWEGLPQVRGADIDVIIGRDVPRETLIELLDSDPERLGATLVNAKGLYLTLCCRPPRGLPVYLNFDFGTDYAVGPYLISSGEMLLAGRRRHRGFWVPAAATGFEIGVARAILKGKLDVSSTGRLSRLFEEDTAGSKAILARFWPEHQAREIGAAAATGDWRNVLQDVRVLCVGLRSRLIVGSPVYALRCLAFGLAARAVKLLDPPGVNVVLLGPDGAGKSSTIAALEGVLAPLFARIEVRGFAPTLRQMLHRPPRSTSTPHALKPRSLAASLLRAGWWTAYGLWSHVGLHFAKVRSTLILNDRHFVDILVDPVRYRYGGPRGLLSALSRLMPRPDLVILLHGPAEVLQARKKELSVAETERQLRDYRALVGKLPGSHIVDSARPFEEVVGEISELVVMRLSSRSPGTTGRRHALPAK